jgi:flagellar M-ring protein FliF
MDRRQLTLFGILFALALFGVVLVYVLFLRQEQVVLFQDIREQEAAEIVTELDRLGLEYQLEDGGRRIMVAEGIEDQARVAIAGSDIAIGGVVGFELFNESDMGLTEFAQQVNFQRALQGELARTIMMMDGISFARVHISLPERQLFRAQGVGPKAAVTVQPQAGTRIDPANVLGIQLLVASSVPELEAADVAVLDQGGQLISRQIERADAPDETLDEKSALEAYFRARAETVAAAFLPGTEFQVRVSALSLPPGARRPTGEVERAGQPTPDSREPAPRDFALNVALRTSFALASADQEAIRRSVADALGLRPELGDNIRFEVADLAVPVELATPTSGALATGPDSGGYDIPPEEAWVGPSWLEDIIFSRWLLLIALVLLVIAIPLWRRRSGMSDEERQEFADQLDALLLQRQEQGNG